MRRTRGRVSQFVGAVGRVDRRMTARMVEVSNGCGRGPFFNTDAICRSGRGIALHTPIEPGILIRRNARPSRLMVAASLFGKGWDAWEEGTRMFGTLFRRPRIGGRLGIETLYLFLKSFHFMPGLQTAAHNTEIKLFHHNEILVHIKEDVTGNLLLFEYVAVFVIDAKRSEALCGFMLIPDAYLFLGRLTFFFFVRLMAIDVGHTVTEVAAVFALGIVSHPGFWGCQAMSWSTQVGDMLIDNA